MIDFLLSICSEVFFISEGPLLKVIRPGILSSNNVSILCFFYSASLTSLSVVVRTSGFVRVELSFSCPMAMKEWDQNTLLLDLRDSCRSVCLSLSLSVCLSVSLSVCLGFREPKA